MATYNITRPKPAKKKVTTVVPKIISDTVLGLALIPAADSLVEEEELEEEDVELLEEPDDLEVDPEEPELPEEPVTVADAEAEDKTALHDDGRLVEEANDAEPLKEQAESFLSWDS